MTETTDPTPTPDATPKPPTFRLVNGGEANPTTIEGKPLGGDPPAAPAPDPAPAGAEDEQVRMVSLGDMPPIPADPWILAVLELGDFHRSAPPLPPGGDPKEAHRVIREKDAVVLTRAVELLNQELGFRASARCRRCHVPIAVDTRCWTCPVLGMLATAVAALEALTAGDLSVRGRLRTARTALEDTAPALAAYRDMVDRAWPGDPVMRDADASAAARDAEGATPPAPEAVTEDMTMDDVSARLAKAAAEAPRT